MNIVITGGNGQLGRALAAALTAHNVVIAGREELDITDKAAVTQAVTDAKANVVIHCAAYTNVDGCANNPALAYQINGMGTQNVALACLAAGAEMVYISSNEVFAGTRPDGYKEWMPINPINPYGASKAAGEFHVRHILNRAYIVRTAWLYASGGRNFIHAILNRARSTGALRVVEDEVGNPTWVKDLAAAVAQLIATHQYGTYHFVNKGACSRWAFANEILRLSNLEHVTNEPISSSEFKRTSTPPPWGELHNEAGEAIGITLRPWQEALAEYLQQEL